MPKEMSLESRAKISASLQKVWADPERRKCWADRSEAIRRGWANRKARIVQATPPAPEPPPKRQYRRKHRRNQHDRNGMRMDAQTRADHDRRWGLVFNNRVGSELYGM